MSTGEAELAGGAVPATGDPTAAAARAFELARAGAHSLRRLTVKDRVAHITLLKDVILRRREAIMDRLQEETAKSRSDALLSDIFGVLDCLVWFAEYAPKHLKDRKVRTPIALMGKTSWLWFEPLGTVLIIAPWNYPFYQAVVPIAAAFVTGNSVVYKPSEHSPLEGLIEELLAEAQFAPNWVRIAYGDGRMGAALIDQRPDKIMFTGSTATGRRVMEQAARYLIPLEMELGGKDPMIVFADVNIERAAAGAAWGGLTTCGQSCTSVERIYVQESIYEPFKAALLREVGKLTQAVDRDSGTDIGGMTTEAQVRIVAAQLEDAKAKGAAILTGQQWDGRSRLIPPIVVENLSADMLLMRSETFGPVLPLLRFKTEDEVICMANDCEFGLTASVWSKDLERAKRVSRRLAAGGVSINNVMATEANPGLPFGGIKQSGFGRYKGELGLHTFCNVKSVLVDKDSDKVEVNWYPYTAEKYRLFSELMDVLFSGGGMRNLPRILRAGMKLESYGKAVRRRGRQ